jgi:hypothetical protein
MCFDPPLIASENKVRPEARSTVSTGKGAQHVREARGGESDECDITRNHETLQGRLFWNGGIWKDKCSGRDFRHLRRRRRRRPCCKDDFCKMCRNRDVGRVSDHLVDLSERGMSLQPRGTCLRCCSTHDAQFPVAVFVREIQRDGKHVHIGERARQPATPIFEVCPI